MTAFPTAISHLSGARAGGGSTGGLTPANLDTGWRDAGSWAGWDHTRDSPLYAMPAAVAMDWYTSYDDGELVGLDNTTPTAPVLRRYIVPESGQLTPIGGVTTITNTMLQARIAAFSGYVIEAALAVCRISATHVVAALKCQSSGNRRPAFLLFERSTNGDWVDVAGVAGLPLVSVAGGYTRPYAGISRVGPGIALAHLWETSVTPVAACFGLTVTGNAIAISSRADTPAEQAFHAFPAGNGYSGLGSRSSTSPGYAHLVGVQHQGTGAPVIGTRTRLQADLSISGSWARSGPLRPGVIVSLTYDGSGQWFEVGALSGSYSVMHRTALTSTAPFGGPNGVVDDGIFGRLNDDEGVLVYSLFNSGNSTRVLRAVRVTFTSLGVPSFHQNFEVAPHGAYTIARPNYRAHGGACALNDGRLVVALNVDNSSIPGDTRYITLKA